MRLHHFRRGLRTGGNLDGLAEVKFTHYGWWLFCPVKLGCLEEEAPFIEPRWPICTPLYYLAWGIQSLVIGLCSLAFEDYEPLWYFKVTGEIPCGEK